MVLQLQDLCKQCDSENEILLTLRKVKTLRQETNKLQLLIAQERNARRKRGTFNFIGDISKTLFGTLNNDDLELINKNIDILFNNQNQLKEIVTNETRLIKNILNKEIGEHIDTINSELRAQNNNINTDRKRNHLTNQILMINELILEEKLEIRTIQNAINFAQKGIIHSSILPPSTLIDAVKTLQKTHPGHFPFELQVHHYLDFIKICKISIALGDRTLSYHIKIAILGTEIRILSKLYPLPKKIQNNFVSYVPNQQLILTHANNYILLDHEYIKMYCNEETRPWICKRTTVTHSLLYSKDCESELYKKTNTKPRYCEHTLFRIDTLTYIPLQDSKKVIIIPEKATTLHTTCTTESIELDHPVLITSSQECSLITDHLMLKLSHKSNLNTTYELREREHDINYTVNEHDLIYNGLKNIPMKINDVNNMREYGTTLEESEDILNKMKTEHRLQNISYIGWSALTYIGYGSTTLFLLWILYKCQFFKLLSNCIPKTIKICFFCNTQKITSNTHPTPRMSTPLNLHTDIELRPRNRRQSQLELPEITEIFTPNIEIVTFSKDSQE